MWGGKRFFFQFLLVIQYFPCNIRTNDRLGTDFRLSLTHEFYCTNQVGSRIHAHHAAHHTAQSARYRSNVHTTSLIYSLYKPVGNRAQALTMRSFELAKREIRCEKKKREKSTRNLCNKKRNEHTKRARKRYIGFWAR